MVHLDPNDHTEFENFLTHEECSHIAHIIRRDEHKVLAIPHTSRENDYKGLTAKHTVYNFLNHPDIRPLNIEERLFDLPIFTPTTDDWYNELWIQCWGNCLHQNENIPLHCHEGDNEDDKSLYAMSIYLDGPDPCYTHWNGTPQRNERGTLHVAGKFFEHEVKTNVHTQPRISMAMDVYWKHETMLDNNYRRIKHVRRPIHASTDYKRRLLGSPTPMSGHGTIPATDKYGYNVGSKDWYEESKDD
jgi:hypothetical protein